MLSRKEKIRARNTRKKKTTNPNKTLIILLYTAVLITCRVLRWWVYRATHAPFLFLTTNTRIPFTFYTTMLRITHVPMKRFFWLHTQVLTSTHSLIFSFTFTLYSFKKNTFRYRILKNTHSHTQMHSLSL